MYKIKDLTNQNLNKDLIGKFVDFVVKKLQIDEPFTVYFVDDKENGEKELGKTAMYNPETKSVYVYATNRHPKDMMRSCAHELMHHKQNIAGELGKITPDEAEKQANEAGYILRQFEDGMKGRPLEEGIFDNPYMREKGRSKVANRKYKLKKFSRDMITAVSQRGKRRADGRTKIQKCLEDQRLSISSGFGGKLCVPKNIKFDIKDSLPSQYGLKDWIFAYKDIKQSKKNDRRSVFQSSFVQPSVLPLANSVRQILGALYDLKKLPAVPKGYVTKRAEFFKELKKRIKDLESGKTSTNESKSPQATHEQKKKSANDVYIYTEKDIINARKLMLMFDDGYWPLSGPDGPFGDAVKIPDKLLNDFRTYLGGQDRVDNLQSIYTVNASSNMAINKEDEKLLNFWQGWFDVIGASPDPAGVGAVFDFFNGLIYFNRWWNDEKIDKGFEWTKLISGHFVDGLISMFAIFGLTDVQKISRGPLRAAAEALKDFLRTGRYAITSIQSRYLINLLEQAKSAFTWLRAKAPTMPLSEFFGGGGKIIPQTLKRLNKISGAADTQITTALKRLKGLNRVDRELRAFSSGRITPKMARSVMTGPTARKFLGDQLKIAVTKIVDKLYTAGKVPKEIKTTAQKDTFINDIVETILNDRKDYGLDNKFDNLLFDHWNQNTAFSEYLKGVYKNKLGVDEWKNLPAEELGKRVDDLIKIMDLETVPIIGGANDIIIDAFQAFLKDKSSMFDDLSGEAAGIFSRAVERAVAGKAPTIGRVGKVGAKRAIRSAPVKLSARFIAKNVVGTEGLAGWLYKGIYRSFMKFAKTRNMEAMAFLQLPGLGNAGIRDFIKKKLPFVKWVFDLFTKFAALLVVGKINSLAILYVRYYRPVCGYSPEQYGNVVRKAADDIMKLSSGPAKIWSLLDQVYRRGFTYDDVANTGIKFFKAVVDLISSMFDYLENENTTRLCKKTTNIIGPMVKIKDPTAMSINQEIIKMKRQAKAAAIVEIKNPFAQINKEMDQIIKQLDHLSKQDPDATAEAEAVTMADEATQLIAAASTRAEKVMREAANDPREKRVKNQIKRVVNRAKEIAHDPNATPEQKNAAKDTLTAAGEQAVQTDVDENLSLSLNDVLKEYKEKELNDKFNKLVKGMTE